MISESTVVSSLKDPHLHNSQCSSACIRHLTSTMLNDYIGASGATEIVHRKLLNSLGRVTVAEHVDTLLILSVFHYHLATCHHGSIHTVVAQVVAMRFVVNATHCYGTDLLFPRVVGGNGTPHCLTRVTPHHKISPIRHAPSPYI